MEGLVTQNVARMEARGVLVDHGHPQILSVGEVSQLDGLQQDTFSYLPESEEDQVRLPAIVRRGNGIRVVQEVFAEQQAGAVLEHIEGPDAQVAAGPRQSLVFGEEGAQLQVHDVDMAFDQIVDLPNGRRK